MESPTTSPFLRLPAEIRLMIYELLILPSPNALLEDPHPYTLHITTINPLKNPISLRRFRTIYHTHPPPRPLPYHCSLPTTWTLAPSVSSAQLSKTLPSLLPLNRQIYTEAATVLYSAYTLSFGTAIDAIAPFFADLSLLGKRQVRAIQMTKRALPFIGGSGQEDWSAACACLSGLTNASIDISDPPIEGVVIGRRAEPVLNLTHFTLTVETADQPTYPSTWDRIAPATAADFAELLQARYDGESLTAQADDLLWAEEVRGVKVASGGVVKVESGSAACPRVRNQSIGFWVKLSKSVEEGFAEWIREGMVRRDEVVS